MLQEPEKLIYEINLSNRYCSLVPRSTIKPATGSFSGCMASNDSQAHLKFCFAKGACSLLSHILTQPDSKCLAAV